MCPVRNRVAKIAISGYTMPGRYSKEHMNDSHYSKILQESTFGYTYGRVVYDENDTPVDYIFLDANHAYARMTGRRLEELLNRRVTEIFPDIRDDSFDWIGFFGNIASTGGKAEFEERSLPLDRWFHFSVLSPEPGHFVALSFDITEKRRAEQELVISEMRNQRYIDNAPDSILISDMDGNFTKANPAACAMLGYSEEELLRLNVLDLYPAELRDAGREAFRKLRETGHHERKTRIIGKDGRLITVMVDSVMLPEGQLMAFCKDVTRQEAVAREKELYYIAFERIAQPMIITNRNGVITSVNQAFSDMYGYSREELIGARPKLLNPGIDVYLNLGYSREEYHNLFDSLWANVQNPENGTWKGVVINRRRNGSLVWVNLMVNAVYGSDGKIDSLIGLPIDITNTREMEDKTRFQLYQTIADLAELRDDDTGNHMKRVGIFTRLLGKGCSMNERFCEEIEVFSPMHDIGKVGILDSILRAPRRLTNDEFEVMKTHTVLGHNIVKDKKGFEMAADITLYHHERYDGSGYPMGLKGKAIPLAAQITALADVYDALRSKRPYKEPWPHEETVSYIMESSGKQFGPALVQVFSDLHDRFDSVYRELMD